MRLSRYLLQRQSARFAGNASKVAAVKAAHSGIFTKKTAMFGAGVLFAAYATSTMSKAHSEEELHVKNIGKSEDFLDGQMKQVQIGDDKEKDVILVVRHQGQLYSVGAKCSHFGAPLSTGMLFDDLVICPWHYAVFDIKTGYNEAGPMIDGLPKYEIWEKDGQVHVKVPKKITVNRTPISTFRRDPENKAKFVIIGGGVAGASAAETLRQSGFTGEIVMLSAEAELPYDRSMLTKAMLNAKPEGIKIRSKEYYDNIDIDIKNSAFVTEVDPQAKSVTLKSGEKVQYDKLLVATGGRARKLNVPGHSLNNIFTIREFSDLYKIRETVGSVKNIVIIGGGLIGSEAASNLKLDLKDKVNVTVLGRKEAPMSFHFGPKVGEALQKLAKENGINFKVGEVACFEGDSVVKKVKLTSGEELEADMVVTAIGITPNSDFLKNVALDRDGGLNADVFFRSTNQKDIFGAGDIASFPYHFDPQRIRVEHLAEAFDQGAHAAWNMLGKMVPYKGVPTFWSRQYNKSIGCVGYLKNWDDIVIDGNPDKYDFAAYYMKEGKVIGAAGMGRSKDLMALNHAIRLNLHVTKDYFNGTALDVERLQKILLEKGPKCHCNRSKNMSAPCRD